MDMPRTWILGLALALAACGGPSSDRSSTDPAVASSPGAAPATTPPPETAPTPAPQTDAEPAEPTLAQTIGAVGGDADSERDRDAGDRCDAYGAHMAELLDSDMFPTTIGAEGFADNCRERGISEARIECVLRAGTLGDVSSCAGL